MNREDLLAELTRRGVKLHVDGEQLKVRAPKGAFTPELRAALAANKAEILEFLRGARKGAEAASAEPKIETLPRDGSPLPLSFGQERLRTLARLHPGSPVHNLSIGLRLTGPLDVAALDAALDQIVARHEVLRTSFPDDENGEAFVRVDPHRRNPLPLIDLSRRRDAEEVGKALAARNAAASFDLANGPLRRVFLLRFSAREHRLCLAVHHIASDGWTFDVFLREIDALYKTALGQGEPPPPLKVQYADFAEHQRRAWTPERSKADRTFWERTLDGAQSLEVPHDRPRPPAVSYRGAIFDTEMPRELTEPLEDLGRSRGATLFMTLMAGAQALFHRLTGQQDLIVCTLASGRQGEQTRPLIGYFNTLLPLRVDASDRPSFSDLLERVRKAVSQAYEHQDLPFQELAELPCVERVQLARAIFHLRSPRPEMSLPGIREHCRDVHPGAANFDLHLYLFKDRDGKLIGELEYQTTLFSRPGAERLMGHLARLLAAVVREPERSILDLPIVDEAERSLMLGPWTGDRADGELLPRRVIERAREAPDVAALVVDSVLLSRAELQRRAARLGGVLRGAGVVPERWVMICAERADEILVSVLAAWRAGGVAAIVSRGRLGDLAQVSAPPDPVWLLGDGVPIEETGGETIVRCSAAREAARDEAMDGEASILAPTQLAAAVIESTSALHAGVLLPHAALSARSETAQRVLALGEAPTTLGAIRALRVLAAGGCIVFTDDESADAARLRPDAIDLPRTVFERRRGDFGAGAPPLRVESASFGAASDWAPDVEVRKAYALAEVAGEASTSALRADAEAIPLGKPSNGLRASICDVRGGLLPAGVSGRLAWSSEEALARGYQANPARTAEVFVPDPDGAPGSRRVLTDDEARFRLDGTLEWMRGQVRDAVELTDRPTFDERRAFVAPRDPLEFDLARIWQEFFQVEHLGVKDNFFALGGKSLLALRLVRRVNLELDLDLPMDVMAHAPTVEAMARAVREHSSGAGVLQRGDKTPFFFYGGPSLGLARFLGAERTVYQPTKRQDLEGRDLAFVREQDEAAYYAQEIRRLQPEGPYYLGGFCGWGLMALEIARQLQAQGEQVARVALVEVISPDLSPWTIRAFFHAESVYRRPEGERGRYLLDLAKSRLLGKKMPRTRAAADEEAAWDEAAREARRVRENEPARAWNSATAVGAEGGMEPLTLNEVLWPSREGILEILQPYSGPVTILLARDGLFRRFRSIPETMFLRLYRQGWKKLLRREPDVSVLPGDHVSILLGDVEELSRCLGEALDS